METTMKLGMIIKQGTEKDVNFAEYCERENESLEEYLKVINS